MTKPLEGIRVLELGQVRSLTENKDHSLIYDYCSLLQALFVDRFLGKKHRWPVLYIGLLNVFFFQSTAIMVQVKYQKILSNSNDLLNFYDMDRFK